MKYCIAILLLAIVALAMAEKATQGEKTDVAEDPSRDKRTVYGGYGYASPYYASPYSYGGYGYGYGHGHGYPYGYSSYYPGYRSSYYQPQYYGSYPYAY